MRGALKAFFAMYRQDGVNLRTIGFTAALLAVTLCNGLAYLIEKNPSVRSLLDRVR